MSKKKLIDMHQVFHALSAKTRVQIVRILLNNKEMKVGDLNSKLNILNSRKLKQPGISQHLKVLHTIGILQKERRNREIFYRVDNNSVIADMIKLAKKIGV